MYNSINIIVKPKFPIPCPNRPQILTLKNPKTQFFGLG